MTDKYKEPTIEELSISGSKGGKGGGDDVRTPKEDNNSLFSNSIARIIDLLCEGEIVGLVDGAKSIFLDGVQLQASDGSYNFEGVTVVTRNGTPDQEYMPGFPSTETEAAVNVEMKQASGIIRTISDTDIDALRITVTLPSLLQTNKDNGDVKKSTVEWRIDIKPDGGAWTVVKSISKYGKCTSAYQHAYLISDLASYGAGPWDIRLVRITADSSSAYLQNATFWSSYTEITNARLRYPDTALVGIEINAEQFGSRIPARSYEIDGLKIKVPTNYNPTLRTYTGNWDGTFKTEFSDNPAWVYYDILTNNRYGVDLEAAMVDKWALYTIAQYCDVMVDDGLGDTEPRYVFNGVLQGRTDAIHVLALMASVFRGMPLWSSGLATVSQDSPKDPVKLVNPSNVIDGNINYIGSSIRDRHTSVNVSWNDPDDGFRLQVETVDDQDGIERYGFRALDVSAFGTTSRGQAYRVGKWILETEINQTETAVYKAGFDHADLLPGDIIQIHDPFYAGVRLGGRLVSCGANSCVIDNAITLEVGETYEIHLMTPQGDIVERDVTTASDDNEHSTLAWASAIDTTAIPQIDAEWGITASNVEPRQFQVVDIKETGINEFEIMAAFHDPNKFARVEDGKQFDDPPYTTMPEPNTAIVAPDNPQAEPYTYVNGENKLFGVIFSWSHTRDVRKYQYEVQWKTTSGAFSDVFITTENSYDFKALEAGEYTFRVRATGMGQPSAWLSLSGIEINIAPDAPPDVQNLVVLNGPDDDTFNGKDCEIGWDAVNLEIADSTSFEYHVYDGTTDVPIQLADIDPNNTKLKDYQIEVMTIGDVHLRYMYTQETNFIYTFAMNELDNSGTPIRTFKFRVWARDIYDQLSDNPTVLVVDNPAPTMSGLDPTVTALFKGMKVDWKSITPSDNDLAKFRIYMDTNNPPTTLVAELGKNTHDYSEFDLTTETTYRAQVEPFDEFGVGVKSNVASATPVKIIVEDDITGELINRLLITDSLDTTGDAIAVIYNNVTDTDGIVYNSGDWIQFQFPIEQLLDRVSVWADKTLHVYFSVKKNDTEWTYYTAEADHTLDSEGRLIEATDSTDAEANYWIADAGDGNINIALFPNGLVFSYARMHILTDTAEVYELIFTDQVIAEQIISRDLAAINANLGAINAGTLQSQNWDADNGIFIDLNSEDIKIGGSADPKLWWNSTKIELELSDYGKITVGDKGAIELGDNSKLIVGDSGFIRIGNNIELDTSENSGTRGSMIITEDTSVDVNDRLVLTGVDYMKLTEGSIDFYYWDSDASIHQPYKSLVRIERGVANNNTLTYIPGIFKEEPSIMISPNVGPSFNKDYANQSQTHNYQVKDLEQYQTYRWRFRPVSTLELSDGIGGTIVNETKTSTGDMWSTQTALGANTRKLSVVINTKGYRTQTRSAWVGGKDGYLQYTCAYHNAYFNVVLYYYVNGVWKTITKAYRPGSSGSNYYNLTIATATQSSDIRYFKVKFDYLSTYDTPKKIASGSCLNKIYNTLTIDRYTTNLSGASVITTGSLNWLAIGS